MVYFTSERIEKGNFLLEYAGNLQNAERGELSGYRTKVSLRRRSKSTCKLYIVMRKLFMRNYTNYARNKVL